MPPPLYIRHEGLQLCNFREVSLEEVRQVLTRSVLDPLPTFIQRELVDVTPTFRDTSCLRLR